MIQRRGGGNFAFTAVIGSGSSRMIAVSVSGADPRWNARRPVAISYRIEPKENWSERKSTAFPTACSGDM